MTLEIALIGFAIVIAMAAIVISANAIAWVKDNNAESLQLARLTDLETELTECTDSIAALHKSLAKLRSRVGMRENRAKKKANGFDECPDAREDPDGYKKFMRLQLQLPLSKRG